MIATSSITFTNGSSTNFTVGTNSYLGTVKSGTWNGTAIGILYGGTGTTTWQPASIPFYNGTTLTEDNTNLKWTAAASNLFATNGSSTNFTIGTNGYITNLTSTFLAVDASHKLIATTSPQAALVSGTNIKTVFGTSLLGSGDVGTATFAYGGTGTTTWQTGSVVFVDGSNLTEDNANFFWDNTNHRLGIAKGSASYSLDVAGYINTDVFSGYKMGGNTVLYASTSPHTLALGASAAAAWMAATTSVGTLSLAVGEGAMAAAPTSTLATRNVAVGYFALNANSRGG